MRLHFSGWWGHSCSLCETPCGLLGGVVVLGPGASLGNQGGIRNNSADEDEGGVVGLCCLPPCLGPLVRRQCCRSQVEPRSPGSFSLECSL